MGTREHIANSLQTLREQVARCETQRRPVDKRPIGTGCTVLDQLLPAGGLRCGTLVEWLEEEEGSGAGVLMGLAAREACRAGGHLVVLDRVRQFYPLALVAWGVRWERVVVVRATQAADELWAADQALRCAGVAAVWWPQARLADKDFRRLQLAAEQGGTLGLLGRPAQARGQPSWADVQWLVSPRAATELQQRRLAVALTRCRGGTAGRQVELEIDDRTGALRELPGGERQHHEATYPLSTTAAGAASSAERRA